MLRKAENSRDLNRRLILEQIRGHAFISRREIVDATGLSKAAVSSFVAELMAAGLVEEVGSQRSAIGRPRIMLALVPDAGLVLGAELTSQECRVILANLQASPLRHVVKRVSGSDLSVEPMLALLEACVAEATEGIDEKRILGMGVTIPGVVDPVSGTVLLSVILPWRNVALLTELGQRFVYPVSVFSRGNAATWGERWYGAGQDVQNMLFVRVGTGVVAGLVLNGQPYLGQGFGAGELGHVTVQPEGTVCRCGNQGCLATVATTDVLLNRVRQLLRDDRDNALWRDLQDQLERLSLQDVVQAAQADNPVALQALAEIGRWLGVALASVINLLNLDMIILGGPLEAAGEAVLTPLRNELSQRALPTHMARVVVVASTLKVDAASIGAASLVLHQLMAPVPLSMMSVGFVEKASTARPK